MKADTRCLVCKEIGKFLLIRNKTDVRMLASAKFNFGERTNLDEEAFSFFSRSS